MNLGQLRTRTAGAIGLNNSDGHAEQDLMTGWANEAVIQFLIETRCRVDEGEADVTPDEGDYELPNQILMIQQIWLASNPANLLEPKTPEEIFDLRRSATVADMRYFALNGANRLMIYGTPSEADSLMFVYVPRPGEMTDAEHDPSATAYGGIPSEYHPALETYMKWKGAEYDDKETAITAKEFAAQWIIEVQRAKALMARKKGRRAPKAVPGVRARRYLRSDSSWT